MTDLPPDPAPADPAAERRKKLIGRAMVIGLGLLILGEETHPRLNPADAAPPVSAATLDVRVISQQPPGGRCTLYAGYAQALAQHLGAQARVEYSDLRDAHGQGFPSLWLNGSPLLPSDGVIVMPDDILAALGANGISAGSELDAALEEAVEKMLNESA